MTTLRALWKDIGSRVIAGERDAAALISEIVEVILGDEDLTREHVTTTVGVRVNGMVADTVKPSGKTSRVPAGQGDFGWADLPAAFGLEALRRNVRRAYKKMTRARVEAEIVGIIDSSGLDVDSFDTLGDLMVAAGVPVDLAASLAA